MIEQPASAAEQHRNDMQLELVERALSDTGPVHQDVSVAGGLLGAGDRGGA
jgi:hypothetical protein